MKTIENIFEKAVNIILKHEGGLSNHIHDRGGITKYGISKRSYPHVDIANLTLNQAIEIYKCDFWHHIYDQIIHHEISIKAFDFAVNMGPKYSHLILQKSVNFIGHDILEDGLLGQNTLLAINNSNAELLIKAMKLAAEIRYYQIVAKDKKQEIFLKGWLKRVHA